MAGEPVDHEEIDAAADLKVLGWPDFNVNEGVIHPVITHMYRPKVGGIGIPRIRPLVCAVISGMVFFHGRKIIYLIECLL